MERLTTRNSEQALIFGIIFESMRQKHTAKHGFDTREQLARALRDGHVEHGLVMHDELMVILERIEALQMVAAYGGYGGDIGNMKEWFGAKITMRTNPYTNDVIQWQATSTGSYAYMPMPKACVEAGCQGCAIVGYDETELNKLDCAHFSSDEFLRKRRQ